MSQQTLISTHKPMILNIEMGYYSKAFTIL